MKIRTKLKRLKTENEKLRNGNKELKELKELLTEAVKGLERAAIDYDQVDCSKCPRNIDDFCQWKHHDEALKIIGDDE